MDNEIKFSFWNYLPVGVVDKSIVHKWKDMNCNLFMSFRFMENQSNKQDMIDLLDEAYKVGAKVIINDERTEYLRLAKMSKEKFINGVKEAVNDFGGHPALFGFYGGDEPLSRQEPDFCFTMRLLKELLPNHYHYGNLNPYWCGFYDDRDEGKQDDAFYRKKIGQIIKDGKLDIIAFDQYTQCYKDIEERKNGIRAFINGMNNFLIAAKENNVPLYVSLLSIGHLRYREPTEIDIRWQINMAFAMGAKAIIWFYFHQHSKDYGYFNPPFLGEKAYITPMYGKIQRQQYCFIERFKDVFDNIDVDKYGFCGEDFGDINYDPEKEIVDRFDLLKKDLLTLVSYAHYRNDANHKVVIVVNGDQEENNAYSIFFTNGDVSHFDLMPGEMRIFDIVNK